METCAAAYTAVSAHWIPASTKASAIWSVSLSMGEHPKLVHPGSQGIDDARHE
jgi:hypothetical protein